MCSIRALVFEALLGVMVRWMASTPEFTIVRDFIRTSMMIQKLTKRRLSRGWKKPENTDRDIERRFAPLIGRAPVEPPEVEMPYGIRALT